MDSNLIIKPLIHPKCFFDEYPIGYLVRLADLNKYQGATWLFQENLKQRSARTSHYFYGLLKNIDWTGFNQNNYELFLKVSSLYFDMKRIKFCPLCLKESPYIRTKWQLRPSMVCREHRVWLRDACSKCNNPITITSSKINKCECGGSIVDQEFLVASPDMIKMQEFIEGDYFLDECFSDNLESRLNLIIFFNKWLTYRGPIQGLKTCEVARNTLEDAAEALFSGRSGFFNFLKRLNADHFKNFYHDFYRRFNTERFSIFRSMIEEYINQNWEKPLTRRNSNLSDETISMHPWIPLSVASRDYDLPKSILKKSFINGYIRYKREVKEKRTSIYLYRPDIENRYFRFKDIITSKEARLVLGLTKSQFSQLVESEVFKIAISPKESGMGTWCFSLDEMTTLKNKLIVGLVDSGGEVWTFSEIMKYFGGRIENFIIELSKAIENGELKAASLNSKKNGYSSLNFTKKDFIIWLKLKTHSHDLISISVLAKILGINQQFAYELVRYGCIETIKKENTEGSWVTPESLVNFRKKYVLLSKVSKFSNLNSRTLMSYFASRAIYPIDYYGKIKLRQKVYFKEHLKNIHIIQSSLEVT